MDEENNIPHFTALVHHHHMPVSAYCFNVLVRRRRVVKDVVPRLSYPSRPVSSSTPFERRSHVNCVGIRIVRAESSGAPKVAQGFKLNVGQSLSRNNKYDISTTGSFYQGAQVEIHSIIVLIEVELPEAVNLSEYILRIILPTWEGS